MTSLLYSISVAALLSITSLIAVLLRVSPLLSAAPALTAFFASLFLSVTSTMTLLLYALWKWFPLNAWDDGKTIGIALRQGVFLGIAVSVIVLFHLIGILTWWIALLVALVFILIEVALQS
jgi:hypothetical protein